MLSSYFFPPPRKDFSSSGIEPEPFQDKSEIFYFNAVQRQKTPDVGLEPTTTRLRVWRSTD